MGMALAYRQSSMSIIAGSVIRLTMDVLMAINTKGDTKERRNILIYNGPIMTTSNKYYYIYGFTLY